MFFIIVKSGIELFNPAFLSSGISIILAIEKQEPKKNKEELTLQDSNGQ